MPTTASRGARISAGDAIFAVGLFALLVYAVGLGRNLWFFSDEWNFIVDRHDGGHFTAYNGHLWLVPTAIYHALFVNVGLGTYWPYQLFGFLAYFGLGIALYFYARTRVPPLLAAFASLTVMWFATGQFNVLFPLLMNFSIPLLATIAIWFLLDRKTVRADIGAGACLAVALACSGVGLVTAVAVAVELALLRAPLHRWLVFAPPLVLWVLWWAINRDPIPDPGGVGEIVRYATHEVQATFAAFVGESDALGYVLIASAVVLLYFALVRWRSVSPRALGAIAAVGAFALLTAYSRAGFVPTVAADTPRFLWLTGFFLVVAVLEILRGRKLHALAIAGAAALAVVNVVTLVGNLRDYHSEVLRYERTVRTYLVATEALGDRVDPGRKLPVSFVPVHTGEYLEAVDDIGSPIEDVGLRDLGVEKDRRNADKWMIHDLGLQFADVSPDSGDQCSRGASRPLEETYVVHGSATVVVDVGDEPATWSLRRLANNFPSTRPPLAAGTRQVLRIPEDRSTLPWHVWIDGTTAAVFVC